jgi:hypothetical protein
MRIGEIVRQGERTLPSWEPQREAPVEPAPAPAVEAQYGKADRVWILSKLEEA